MKLPNGYGSIHKLSGNRRKPYMARGGAKNVFDSKIGGYKAERPLIGYYSTREEALQALAEYNKNPFNVHNRNLTFSDIYQIVSEKNPGTSKSTINSRASAYKYCAPITDMKIGEIKTAALQEVLDSCPLGYSSKKNIKTLMHMVFEYAVQNDYVSKDYSQFLKVEYSDPTIDRTPFSKSEIKLLWKIADQWDVQVLLILLYTGLRVNELLKNTTDNVDLINRTITVPEVLAKNKTSARTIPIHDKIFILVKRFVEQANRKDSSLIITDRGAKAIYNNMVARNLKKINEVLGTDHKFHDTRHTFITQAHVCKLDELTLKSIVGHSAQGVTAKVYTHISLDEMKAELKKFKY